MGVYYSHYLIPQDNTVRPEPDRIIALIEALAEKRFIVPSTGDATKASPRFMTTPPPEEVIAREPPPERRQGLWARLFGKQGSKQTSKPPRRPDSWKPFLVPPTGESLAALEEPNTLIRWEGHSKAIYPMKTLTLDFPRDIENFPPYLMIELSDDFVNTHTAPYGSDEEDVRQIDPRCKCGHNLAYDESRIRRLCPSCRVAFRPQDQLAEIVDGMTGKKRSQPGGLCHRFAIIIEFGKEMPTYATEANGELVGSRAEASHVFFDTCSTALGIKLNEFNYYS